MTFYLKNNRIKLNIGCGNDYREEWINIDISDNFNPDLCFDVRNTPWKWKHQSIDYIRADNLFEHFNSDELINVMAECWRVLKYGGILWVRVPYLAFPITQENMLSVFRDPTHKKIFTKETFDYWNKENPRYLKYGKLYGCKPFEIIRQVVDDNFLIIELKK